MKERLKKALDGAKTKWNSFGKGIRMGVFAVIGVLIISAIIVGIVSSVKNRPSDYIVLFEGMSKAETADVANILRADNIDIKMTKDGKITVPQTQWDSITLDLSAKGYPKTTPSYSTFFDNLNMTMTEWEKKETLRIALEERLSTTLGHMNGVDYAIVNLSFPASNKYAWDKAEQKASASVLLQLDRLANFDYENVSAVKNLVSSATQQMNPADVEVVDGNTGKTLMSLEEHLVQQEQEVNSDATDMVDDAELEARRITLEATAKLQLQQDAESILSLYYGEGKVRAIAQVRLDYDTITKQIQEYITNEEGLGVPTEEEVLYQLLDDVVDDGGIVGEDENTDIPTYQNGLDGTITSNQATEYSRKTVWGAIGTIITDQIVARGGVKDASIAAVVISEDAIVPDETREEMISLISNATNIPAEKVSFVNRYIEPPEDIEAPTFKPEFSMSGLLSRVVPWLMLLALFVIILIILLIVYYRRKIHRQLRKAEIESQAQIQSLQSTLDEQKRTLQDEYDEQSREQNATTNEVKDFVRENPEITAALIRSLLKND
jgi:flagellar biosynthesis/type III secretory pathway M-ring protein FliF/YscJ